jgi:hypothetical protein
VRLDCRRATTKSPRSTSHSAQLGPGGNVGTESRRTGKGRTGNALPPSAWLLPLWTATRAPSAASRRAIARPMPRGSGHQCRLAGQCRHGVLLVVVGSALWGGRWWLRCRGVACSWGISGCVDLLAAGWRSMRRRHPGGLDEREDFTDAGAPPGGLGGCAGWAHKGMADPGLAGRTGEPMLRRAGPGRAGRPVSAAGGSGRGRRPLAPRGRC